MKTAILAVMTWMASAGLALAHPLGHDFPVLQSLFHVLTEPDHLALICAVVAVAVFLFVRMKRRA
jgi:hydrogenase/urease accessory protein HupE